MGTEENEQYLEWHRIPYLFNEWSNPYFLIALDSLEKMNKDKDKTEKQKSSFATKIILGELKTAKNHQVNPNPDHKL